MLDLDGLLRVMAAMRANEISEVIITHDRVELRATGLQPHSPTVAVQASDGLLQSRPAAATNPVAVPNPAPAEQGAGRPGESPETDSLRGTFAIKAPMPGVIHCHPANLPHGKPMPGMGDRVEARAVVAVLEAMKMNNEILTAKPGIIRKMNVENGQNVKTGQVLLLLEEVSD